MDRLLDQDSREARNVGDYFLGAFRSNSRVTSQMDQQFAKPIEDEDLFGFDDQIEANPQKNDSPDKQTSVAQSQDDMIDSQDEHEEHDIQDEENRDISREQTNSQPQIAKQPPPPSPAQTKRQRIKEQIAQQVREMGLTPRTIGTGFDENAEIEVRIQQGIPLPNSNVFEKIFNKAKATALSPECDKKLSREAHRDSLRKRISSQKRKIWESFQPKLDEFADEEDIIAGRSELDGSKKDDDHEEDEEGAFDIDKGDVSEEEKEASGDEQSDVDYNLDKDSNADESEGEFPYADGESDANEDSEHDEALDELPDAEEGEEEEGEEEESEVEDHLDNDSEPEERRNEELDVYVDREAEVDGDDEEEEDALLEASSGEEEYDDNNFLRLDDEEEENVPSSNKISPKRRVIIDDEDDE